MTSAVRNTSNGLGRLVPFALAAIVISLLSFAGPHDATADSTGLRNPAAQAVATGGDGDGFETNPTQAFTDANGEAEDRDSGTNGNLSCTDSGKDRHTFSNYGFTIPAGAAINGIEVLVDARLDSATGFICSQLSWDAGATWTTAKQTSNLTDSFANYTLGGTADAWGRAWSSADFSNSNFRLRVIDVANNTSGRFRVDWIAAQVHYTPAPPDTTGPATSSVAAANAGGGMVTLTATVSDAGTGNANVAASEYFIDTLGTAGTGTAMSAADGAFNSMTEGVTASVNMSSQPPGDHTLYVRGRDVPGNWGAAAFVVVNVTTGGGSTIQATITLVSGTLSINAYPVAFPAVTLDGLDQVAAVSPSPWRAIDSRGTGSGWNVTLTSTNFASGTGTIPAGNFRVRLLPGSITTVSGGAPPATLVSSYQALSNSLPLKLLAAIAGTGMGTYNFVPDFSLLVPASTSPGDYQASIVVSVNSGP